MNAYDEAPNVYYNPGAHGLTVVCEIDFSDGCYQFDMRVVWRHRDGQLYTARDSGCSCPTPFEDYTGLGDLEVVDYGVLRAELNESGSREYITAREAGDYLGKLLRAVDARNLVTA